MTGACNCGAVRFEVSEPLLGAGYCHCTRCQRRTGTATQASGLAAPGSFRITQGEEHVGAWAPGDGLEKCFCRECGAHLFARSADGSTVVVRLGALDEDPGVRPAFHQFVANAAAWEPIPDDGLPRFDGPRPT